MAAQWATSLQVLLYLDVYVERHLLTCRLHGPGTKKRGQMRLRLERTIATIGHNQLPVDR